MKMEPQSSWFTYLFIYFLLFKSNEPSGLEDISSFTYPVLHLSLGRLHWWQTCLSKKFLKFLQATLCSKPTVSTPPTRKSTQTLITYHLLIWTFEPQHNILFDFKLPLPSTFSIVCWVQLFLIPSSTGTNITKSKRKRLLLRNRPKL